MDQHFWENARAITLPDFPKRKVNGAKRMTPKKHGLHISEKAGDEEGGVSGYHRCSASPDSDQ